MARPLDRLRAAVGRAGRTWPDGVAVSPAELMALVVLLAGSVALTAVVWTGTRASPLPAEASAGLRSETALPGTAPPPGGAPARPPTGLPGAPGADPPPATADAPADSAGSAELVVHVAGHVHRPGVLRLPAGARVVEAVEAAGGATAAADLSLLNLARPLVDGEQVVVPAVGDVVAAVPQVTGGGPAGPLDLNAATAAQLQELPGIGEVTAQRIIDHRDALGGFADVTQLLEVPGIGPGRFAELQDLVRV